MKRLIIFLLLSSLSSIGQDKVAVQNLIQDSFDDVFSSLKKEAVQKYYTDDFLLLEAGVVWTVDSVYSYIERGNERINKVERVNSFEFLQTKVKGKRAWIAYQNYADIRVNDISVKKLHWLESGVAIKTKEGWKLEMLHSTRVKD
jgi:predicted DNA-binding protein YlxM (UPF0122 family)